MRSLLEGGYSSGETPEYRGGVDRSHSIYARSRQKVSYERLRRNESAATLARATTRGSDGSRGLVVGDGAHAGDLRETGFLQRAIDAVPDPLRVPPLERRDRDAGDEHLEVQVIADGQACRARASHLLALGHPVADLHLDRRQVRVERLQPEPVVEDHGVAVDRERAGEGDDAGVGGRHRRLLGGGEVVSVVDLRVDGAAVVDVRARLREVREHLRVARLGEGACPERRLGRPRPDLTLRGLGLLALLPVDGEEAVEQRLRGRALRQQLNTK